MIKKIAYCFFNFNLLILAFVGCSVAAAEKSTQTLDSVTVTAEAEEMRSDLALDSLTNPYRIETSARVGTEIFTAEDITNLNPRDVFDLLNKATGVSLSYQGRRKQFIISQRGGGSFTYIIDGAVLPSVSDRILYSFPVTAIEQLQVVRGATALTLGPSINIGASSSGSGLNTGYIIIRTKQPEKTQAVLSASMEKSKGGHPVATTEDIYLGLHFGEETGSEGYVGGMLMSSDRPSQDSWFDGRDAEGGMANAGVKKGKLSINMMAFKEKGRLEFQRGVAVDGTLSDHKWYYDPVETSLFVGDLNVQWSDSQITMLNLYKVNYEQTEYNKYFSSPKATMREYEEETSGISLRHNIHLGDTLIQLGGQLSNSEGYGANQNIGLSDYDTTIMGGSASVEQTLLGGAVVVDGGFRYDRKHIDNSVSVDHKAVNKLTEEQLARLYRANSDSDLDPALIYAAGVHWQLSDLYAFDARYFYGDQGSSGDFNIVMDDGSEPGAEKQQRIELTLSAELASWFNPAVTWFDVDIENAKKATSKTYETSSGVYYTYTEADELRRGIELLLQGQINQNTSYRLSWTRMVDNKITSDGVSTDSSGVSTPKNLYTMSLQHKWQAYRFNFSLKKVDEWTEASSPMGTFDVGGLGDYTLIDANVQRDFFIYQRLLTANLYGRNLGDKHYSTRYVTGYYPDRGLTVGLGLTVNF